MAAGPHGVMRTFKSLIIGRVTVALTLLSIVGALPGTAIGGPNHISNKSDEARTAEDAEYGFRNGSVVVAPIPSKNAEFGFGLMLGALYLFKADENSKNSQVGLAYYESENGSSFYGGGFDLSWDNDRWFATGFAGHADLNYNAYIADIPIPLAQSGDLAEIELLRGMSNGLALGGTIQYLSSVLKPNTGGALPPELTPQVDMELVTFGLAARFDTRDDSFYPTSGYKVDADLTYGTDLGGLIADHQKAVFLANGYLSIGDNGVLAGRFAGCLASEDTPFFSLCSIGGTDSLRGFTPMRFIGESLVSAQVEYRHRLSQRFGLVAFAGAGVVGSAFSPSLEGDFHAAAGVGVRVRLSKKFGLDYAIDVAVNDLKEEIYYLYVGQRF